MSGQRRPGTAQTHDRSEMTLPREDFAVQLGLVGLGKMGGNMAERIRRAGHEVVGYDRSSGNRDVDTLEKLVAALDAPRVVWVMVPSGEPTRSVVRELSGLDPLKSEDRERLGLGLKAGRVIAPSRRA